MNVAFDSEYAKFLFVSGTSVKNMSSQTARSGFCVCRWVASHLWRTIGHGSSWMFLGRWFIDGCHCLSTVWTCMDRPTALRNGEFRVHSSSAETGPDSCTCPQRKSRSSGGFSEFLISFCQTVRFSFSAFSPFSHPSRQNMKWLPRYAWRIWSVQVVFLGGLWRSLKNTSSPIVVERRALPHMLSPPLVFDRKTWWVCANHRALLVRLGFGPSEGTLFLMETQMKSGAL